MSEGILELFTVIFFQDWAAWGIFTVIPGNPRRTKGDSQHLKARPELQDWLRSELFTVKNSRTGPFSNYLGNNFELYSLLKRQRTGELKACALSLSLNIISHVWLSLCKALSRHRAIIWSSAFEIWRDDTAPNPVKSLDLRVSSL